MSVAALGSRNPTEDAILVAAREALADEPYDRVTIDGIARRAFVSRTTVYFYFPNKRAVVDRLIQRSFADMHNAGAPYFEGEGDPRAELRAALAGVVEVVDRDASILRLALWLYGREDQIRSACCRSCGGAPCTRSPRPSAAPAGRPARGSRRPRAGSRR
ncbi:MAG: TetR/AcrR family transcriptional regulator, ethionamide resistance regulator [Solirubrobacteraceae bacterium]|jgi:AcrR family transcriptional regulator|nr:TetR/AcrR family transcriptional regulator, ethionamide resistance regulator [Solirubrobacteraceae bacterium]